MDMFELEVWLTTTVPGIILLGAAGGIVALILVKVSTYLGKKVFALFSILLPTVAERTSDFVRGLAGRMMYRLGYEFGYSSGYGIPGLISFFSFHLSRVIFWFFMTVLFGSCAVLLLRKTGTWLLSSGSYITIVLAMLAFFWACRHLYTISCAHKSLPKSAVKVAFAQERIRWSVQKNLPEGTEVSNEPKER